MEPNERLYLLRQCGLIYEHFCGIFSTMDKAIDAARSYYREGDQYKEEYRQDGTWVAESDILDEYVVDIVHLDEVLEA